MNTLKKLHDAIMKGDYEEVEELIINQRFDPLRKYKERTAIQLCYSVQAKKINTDLSVYQDMLKNLLLPRADRILIGSGEARRGDMMRIDDEGSIQILSRDTSSYDSDDPSMRQIGTEDYRLSEDNRRQYHNERAYRNS